MLSSSSFSSSFSGAGAGAVLVVTAAALWGTTGAVLVLAPYGVSAFSAGAARIVLGGLLLVLVAGRALAGLLAGPRTVWGLAVLGAAGVAVSQTTYFVAVSRTGVAVATIVTIGSAPAFAGLLALLSGTRLGRRWQAATCLAVAGSALLVGGGAADPAGIALALVSGCAYAVQSAAAERLVRDGLDPLAAAAAVFGLAALALLPALAAGDVAWLATGRGAAVTGYLGAVTTAVAYLLYFRGLRTTDTTTATTLTLVEPVIAAGLGLALLGEHLSGAGGAGLVLVASGLVLLLRT
ncbi:DME family drug/metabolite transporter [Actinocorallia herbida]|uniref:DME family drug/metabolite transporter n=1 Tax=Actinocorallia herbida TaxID=58109 RepID=A0A3N1CRN6_9ACTN|nr:EamA family transporter [Actinocorallia herbida]ROO83865.1 DME family drug/metabolite transporter [Actinocorallia herbida]